MQIKISKTIKIIGSVVIGIITVVGGIISITDWYNNKTIPNVDGNWKITTITEKSTYKPYIGLELRYNVFVHQVGNSITADGEKCWENGKDIPFHLCTKIKLDGTIEKDKMVLKIIEKGTKRETEGCFICNKTAENKFVGTFKTTAANSSGKAEIELLQ